MLNIVVKADYSPVVFIAQILKDLSVFLEKVIIFLILLLLYVVTFIYTSAYVFLHNGNCIACWRQHASPCLVTCIVILSCGAVLPYSEFGVRKFKLGLSNFNPASIILLYYKVYVHKLAYKLVVA